MKILLTNDDGIKGEGLWAMARALVKETDFEVVISAPMRQQSGMSHALSVLRSLEYMRVETSTFEAWAIDGTPTDCVKIYLEEMNDGAKVDAVISGINDGSNLATDVLYSGTVGAALEGYLHKIPSLAVSLDIKSEITFDEAAEVTKKYFIEMMNDEEFFLHNINFPLKFRDGRPQFRSARLGERDYINAFARHTDENGRTFFKVGGKVYDIDCGEGTDIFAAEQGYIAVTPLHADTTDYESVKILENRLKKI